MITRFEIAVRPGMQDSRGVETAQRIRSFLGVPVESVATRVAGAPCRLRSERPQPDLVLFHAEAA